MNPVITLYPGKRVIVLEHWRAHGKIGGWERWEQEHEIVKVNRRTVRTHRILPNGETGQFWIVPIDRILRNK